MVGDTKEIVLALSGGGARGAYHLGVLQYLDEQNIKVKAICGTSIGSIIAASYASGVSPKEQLEIFKSKGLKKMFSFAWFRESLFNVNVNIPCIDALIKKSRFEELDIPVYITAMDLQNGDEIYFNRGDIRTLCTASSALVPMFKPVEHEGKVLVDGGFFNHMPYKPLKKYDYPLVGVNLNPIVKKASRPRLMSYLKKVIAIRMFITADSQRDEYDYYISNDEILKYSIFSLKNFDELFELGYADAKKVFSV
ncbi:patatin [Sulfurimonas lithotrophica]|uniref:Patatin n=1 Tax=Sulfurimonas lithotrophica TaxID=2590022 RepID=A0A5P8P1M4_9BACT|nr:patatin-like phospholipase family protein [Sulfurimonas lithotrophica]QFR49599.1 patatin [Sulfurimonas lithotrophica]